MQNNFLLPWFSILNFLILLLLFEYFPFFCSLVSPLSLSHGSSDQNQSGLLVIFIKFPFFLSHGLWFLLHFLVLYLSLLRKFLHPKVKSDVHVCGLWLVAENSSIWSPGPRICETHHVGLYGGRKTREMMEEEKRNMVGGRLRLGLIRLGWE